MQKYKRLPDALFSSLREKIEYHLEPQPDGCWIWPMAKDQDGYGLVRWEGRMRRVHRAYMIELGHEYPDGWVTDHLCRVTSCANPDHLEIVTHRENVIRGAATKYRYQLTEPEVEAVSMVGISNANKTHCIHGHRFTPENTSIRPNGGRYCRACWRITSKRKYDKRHAKDVSPAIE